MVEVAALVVGNLVWHWKPPPYPCMAHRCTYGEIAHHKGGNGAGSVLGSNHYIARFSLPVLQLLPTYAHVHRTASGLGVALYLAGEHTYLACGREVLIMTCLSTQITKRSTGSTSVQYLLRWR
jgi:hypothetical protein